MTTRTSIKSVTFKRPFVLGDFDEVQPAGIYRVETDEELLEGISFPAYRRILTVIHLHTRSGRPGLTRTLTIDPNELDAALKRDQEREQASAEVAVGRDAIPKTPKGTTESRREEAAHQAIERGEDEGMIVHPR